MTADPALVDRAEARVGSVLRGKYRIDGVLGIGGMAVVYAATHRNTKRFAVKVLHPELSLSSDIRTRFLREGYAANSVGHPGTVSVLDDDVAEDGAAFIVMELLEGASVEALWERSGRRLDVRAAVSVGDQLLDVLSAAHGKGVVHRDIKPGNLFVTQDGVVKVLDFGIARARDAAASGAASAQATGTGMLLGTPAFMAPEQALAQSSDIDARTDVWAAAATLFTLVSGQFVHPGDSAQQLLVRAATARARPLATVAPDVPRAVADVVDRGLAFDKAARWSSAGEMREALRAAHAAAYGVAPGLLRLESFVPRPPGRSEQGAGRSGDVSPVPATAPALTTAPLVVAAPLERTAPALAPAAPREIVSPAGAPAASGASTDSPVSAQPARRPAARRHRGAVALSITAVVAVGVGARVLATRWIKDASSSSPASAAADSLRTGEPAPRLDPGAPPARSSDVALERLAPLGSTPPEAAARTPPAIAVTDLPQVPPAKAQATAVAAGKPVSRPDGGAVVPMARAASVAGPSPAQAGQAAPANKAPEAAVSGSPAGRAAPTANCNPPFYFDGEGTRIFKKECL
ncbi:MAG TPA: protein kinase [Polyangiaceae bacterium]|nr:protein kinase [Polyangiaceae bacterium]